MEKTKYTIDYDRHTQLELTMTVKNIVMITFYNNKLDVYFKYV